MFQRTISHDFRRGRATRSKNGSVEPAARPLIASAHRRISRQRFKDNDTHVSLVLWQIKQDGVTSIRVSEDKENSQETRLT
jgi:hypothetical protein